MRKKDSIKKNKGCTSMTQEKCKRKMNIVMLGHKRIPSREGGVEIVVEELSTRMVEKGYHVTCLNRRGHHVSGKEFDKRTSDIYKGIRIKTIGTIDRRGLAAATSSIIGAIKATLGNYDVVHFHAEGPCAMMWLPKLFGKRCIATIHGLDHQRAKWGKIASSYIMFGEKTAVRCADEIIVLSAGVQDYFKKTYNRDTKFIPNGVIKPSRVSAEAITKKYGLKEDSYILFLARLVREKGITYLIEAFKNVKTDKKLVIAGGSSDSDDFAKELRKLAKGDDRIIFTGFVQGKMLEELYSNAYVYTLPSDLEGMPLSLLEAMSYGNCCLVSDIAECTEVVEDRAVVFEKSNVEQLTKVLQKLCDEPELVKQYKDGASEFICGKYNWDYIVEKTLGLYQEICWEKK